MENYLLDGRCSISNNAAENSIAETAKANGLNVYTYLEYLLMYMPDTDYHNHPEHLEQLMPCRIAYKQNVESNHLRLALL